MATAGFKSDHWLDGTGNPAGGNSFGNGFSIGWQNGPLGRDDDRKAPNGAFVEDIISAAIDRIEFYQNSKFACQSNDETIKFLKQALLSQQTRTKDREDRKVEGTHTE